MVVDKSPQRIKYIVDYTPEDEGKAAWPLVGSEEHRQESTAIANKAITLVKDTQYLLPIDPNAIKQARVFLLESTSGVMSAMLGAGTKAIKEIIQRSWSGSRISRVQTAY